MAKKKIFMRILNPVKTEFSYGTYKLRNSSIYPAEVRRISDNELLDIGYSSNIIDSAAITTFASGGHVRYSKLYDQTNNFAPLTHPSSGLQPLATADDFTGLDYIRDTVQESGLYYQANNLPINFAQDWVVQYCFRNETQTNNSRLSFSIKTNLAGKEGCCTVCIRPSGTNYIVACTHIYNISSGDSNSYYQIPKGDTTTNFTLYTFSKIGGVFKFHRNNVEQSSSELVDHTGGIILFGIYLGVGYSTDLLTQGKINNTRGLEMISGNFSSFDLSAYNLNTMSRFGI